MSHQSIKQASKMWSLQKQAKVTVLVALSATLFYFAFTIDRVGGKVFEHSNVVKLDARNFDEQVRVDTALAVHYHHGHMQSLVGSLHRSHCSIFSLHDATMCQPK